MPWLDTLLQSTTFRRRRASVYRMLEGAPELKRYHGSETHEELVEAFEEAFAQYVGTDYAVLTGSGNAALEYLMAHYKAPGAELLMSPFTCKQIAPIINVRFHIKFADISLTDYNMDLVQAAQKCGPKTRVLYAMHLYGSPMDMESAQELAHKKKLILLEDVAHSLGARYNDKPVGSFGEAAIFSLRKNMAVQNGGVLATNDKKLALHAHTQSRKLSRARVPQDTWALLALLARRHVPKSNIPYLFYSRYGPGEGTNHTLLSRMGLCIALHQLEGLDAFIDEQARAASQLRLELEDTENLILPGLNMHVKHAFTRFVLRFEKLTEPIEQVVQRFASKRFETGLFYKHDYEQNLAALDDKKLNYINATLASHSAVPLGLQGLNDTDLEELVELIKEVAGQKDAQDAQ